MKEYWVNVYDDYAIGACMVNKKLCREIARKLKYMIASKVIYRIHVKMKEPKLVTSSEILDRREAYLRYTLPTSKHWMD